MSAEGLAQQAIIFGVRFVDESQIEKDGLGSGVAKAINQLSPNTARPRIDLLHGLKGRGGSNVLWPSCRKRQ